MNIYEEMRSDFQYLSKLRKQIVQIEGEPETEDVPLRAGYDWDSVDADAEDREYATAVLAAMAPIYEDESTVYVPPREGFANV